MRIAVLQFVHETVTFLPYDTTIDDAVARGLLHPNGEWRLVSPEEMAERWKGREQGLAESERIAYECDFNLSWVRPPLPKFPVPAGYNDDTFLREKVYEGARERWGEIDMLGAMQQLGVVSAPQQVVNQSE